MVKTISLGVSSLACSRLAYGCWRVAGDLSEPAAGRHAAGRRAILAAYDAGYTLFDNADVYGRGEAEQILGAALKEAPGMRDRVVITSKCGVRLAGDPAPDSPHRWDFSAKHIVASCEASLRRIGMDCLDLYMLHRPDYLANPEEIATAFSRLKADGKVRWFGVSNFRPSLLTALQVACPMPLIVHQVEISLAKLDAFSNGVLDQCLIEKITPMAWSPLAGGLIGGGAKRLLAAQQSYRVETFLPVVDAIAGEKGVSRSVLALAWLLKHPANIVPVIGSTNPERIREAAKSTDCDLSREEWYRLLTAARGEPLP